MMEYGIIRDSMVHGLITYNRPKRTARYKYRETSLFILTVSNP